MIIVKEKKMGINQGTFIIFNGKAGLRNPFFNIKGEQGLRNFSYYQRELAGLINFFFIIKGKEG